MKGGFPAGRASAPCRQGNRLITGSNNSMINRSSLTRRSSSGIDPNHSNSIPNDIVNAVADANHGPNHSQSNVFRNPKQSIAGHSRKDSKIRADDCEEHPFGVLYGRRRFSAPASSSSSLLIHRPSSPVSVISSRRMSSSRNHTEQNATTIANHNNSRNHTSQNATTIANHNTSRSTSSTTSSSSSPSSDAQIIGSRLHGMCLRSSSSSSYNGKAKSSAHDGHGDGGSRRSRSPTSSSSDSANHDGNMVRKDSSKCVASSSSSSSSRGGESTGSMVLSVGAQRIHGTDSGGERQGEEAIVRLTKRMMEEEGGGMSCLAGLQNEGNTCYLNACIQCLSHTLPLAAALLHGYGDGDGDGDGDGYGSVSGSGYGYGYGGTGTRTGTESGTGTGTGTGNSSSSSSFLSLNGLTTANAAPSSRSRCGGGERSTRKHEARRLAIEFQALVRAMWWWSSSSPPEAASPNRSSSTTVSTSASKFLHHLQEWDTQFSGYRQQDAQEAMRAILDGLHEYMNQVSEPRYLDIYKEFESSSTKDELAQITWDYHKSLNDSVIQDIFCGQLQSTIECSVCRRSSHCFDPFLDLSLPLPREHGFEFRASNKWQLDIHDCLALFVAPEVLNGNDKYKCATCKVSQRSTKKLSIYRAPLILVLHLKRFSGFGSFSYKKDDTPISYPLRGLDLAEFIANPEREHKHGFIYDLYAVCHHSGSIGHGHYTSQCKNVDGLWYSFNDSFVTPILDESRVVSSSAYILFYQLRL